ncbi:hypothetical protein YC2023_013334 [Brassica napus]
MEVYPYNYILPMNHLSKRCGTSNRFCFPDLHLDKGSDVKGIYPDKKEWFSLDFTWRDLEGVSSFDPRVWADVCSTYHIICF